MRICEEIVRCLLGDTQWKKLLIYKDNPNFGNNEKLELREAGTTRAAVDGRLLSVACDFSNLWMPLRLDILWIDTILMTTGLGSRASIYCRLYF